MKYRKRVARLEARRTVYDEMIGKAKFSTEGYKRPGSLNK